MSGTPVKRKALGRGLGALLTQEPPPKKRPLTKEAADESRIYFEAPVEEVYPNPDQPRRRFVDAELDELAASIRELGIIQPLIVRQRAEGGYILIAGERRWRAAQRAALDRVPVVVQDISDREAFEAAIVENVQREDLNPIEEAEAFSRLVTDYDYTQAQVAERVGKDRSTIANALRLLKLPIKVRSMVEDQSLSMGHARALLALPIVDDIEMCARAVATGGLSVRATEALVKQRLNPALNSALNSAGPKRPNQGTSKSASVRDVESRLTKSLGARVELREDKSGNGGRIEVKYSSLDDLDRLLAKLLGSS